MRPDMGLEGGAGWYKPRRAGERLGVAGGTAGAQARGGHLTGTAGSVVRLVIRNLGSGFGQGQGRWGLCCSAHCACVSP